MPLLGEIRLGRDIGKDASTKYIWHACIDCGKERWVRFMKGKPEDMRCFQCALNARKLSGENNSRWGGGRKRSDRNYIRVYLYPDDFFYPMTDSLHYVLEHRLIMAKHLGRCLQFWEVVHHKNGIRDDNRLENLQLLTANEHNKLPKQLIPNDSNIKTTEKYANLNFDDIARKHKEFSPAQLMSATSG